MLFISALLRFLRNLVMAGTALEAMRNPELIAKAKEEIAERLDGIDYVCPIPANQGKMKRLFSRFLLLN